VETLRIPGLGVPALPYLTCDGKFLALYHLDKEERVQVWSLDESPPRRILSELHGRFPLFRNSRQIS
jgi:hypothetical protein